MAANSLTHEETAPSSHDPRQRVRPLRWPWRAGAGAVSALGASTSVYPRDANPTMVVFGIDGYGWSYLLGVVTALLAAVAIGGTVQAVVRQRHGWWADLLQTFALAALLVGLVIMTPIALLGGALSFKNSYREVGSVDGRTIVVQQFAGWRGADSLDAGYRSGALVTFDADSDTRLRRTFTDISTWRFRVTTTPSRIEVHYRSSDTPAQTGTLTLSRTSWPADPRPLTGHGREPRLQVSVS